MVIRAEQTRPLALLSPARVGTGTAHKTCQRLALDAVSVLCDSPPSSVSAERPPAGHSTPSSTYPIKSSTAPDLDSRATASRSSTGCLLDHYPIRLPWQSGYPGTAGNMRIRPRDRAGVHLTCASLFYSPGRQRKWSSQSLDSADTNPPSEHQGVSRRSCSASCPKVVLPKAD